MQSGRWYLEPLRKAITRPFVHILFGARQTGKTTLLRMLVRSKTTTSFSRTCSSEFASRPSAAASASRCFPRRVFCSSTWACATPPPSSRPRTTPCWPIPVRFSSNGWASNCGSACSIYLGRGRLTYLRTKSGAEIDFIVDLGKRLLPIEVKWTDTPNLTDARHPLAFLDEQHTHAPHGYIVCRCPRPLRLHERITALPWWWV
jgi:hypothetical protein